MGLIAWELEMVADYKLLAERFLLCERLESESQAFPYDVAVRNWPKKQLVRLRLIARGPRNIRANADTFICCEESSPILPCQTGEVRAWYR